MNSTRHLLVVASHCEAEGRLTNLHSTAHAFAEVLRDDLRGHCGIDDSKGVLLDADRVTTETAVARAAESARDKVLVLVWIGHGMAHNKHFYLMPFGARSETIEDSGIELTSLLKKIREADPSGILLAIDACQSGTALVSALNAWVDLKLPHAPLVILTATDEHAAFDLSFSKRLTELLRDGIGDADRDLSCADLRDRLCQITGTQTAQLLGYYDAPGPTPIWMSHNVAFDRKEYSRAPDLRMENLMLSQVIESVAHRLKTESSSMAFMADTGVGKTILSAMLVQMPYDLRKITGRQHLVDASLFADKHTVFFRVVEVLAEQLKLYKGFRDASLPFQERKDLPDQEQMLLGPLRSWVPTLIASNGAAKITLLLDSIDSIESARPKVLTLLGSLAAIPGVRVLMTGRSGAEIPDNLERYDLGRLTDTEVQNYLSNAGIDPTVHDALVKRIGGNWLCTTVFAKEVSAGNIRDPAKIAALTLKGAFEGNLQRLMVCAEYPEEPDGPLTVVFITLAAAGVGAVMPGSLLRAACAAQGGPATDEQLDKELKKLVGLIARGAVGEMPMWGLFHQELVDYVSRSEKYQAHVEAAHAAIVETLQVRVPNRRDADPIEWRYAFDRELDHRRIVGKLVGELNRFNSIGAADPRDNRSLWERLNRVMAETLKPDDPDVLMARNNLAYWTGKCGDARAARVLFAALLPDRERVLGADHPDVLTTRNNLASFTGQCGDARAARVLFAALLPDRKRVLGADHPDTLRTRNNLAYWTGQCGNAHAARDLFAALLPDQERRLRANHPDVLTTRSNFAHWTGKCGDARAARVLFAALLPDRERELGADHPDVLTTRNNLAYWTGQCGNAHAARDLFAALLPDQERRLGADHRDTLRTRSNLAYWTGQCGDARAARDLFAALLPDEVRVLGADHPDVLMTRSILSWWTAKADEVDEAIFSLMMRELNHGIPDISSLSQPPATGVL